MSLPFPDAQTPIPIEHVRETCRLGQGAKTCSYLLYGRGWVCGKAGAYAELTRRRREDSTMSAMGDNCGGPPWFVGQGPALCHVCKEPIGAEDAWACGATCFHVRCEQPIDESLCPYCNARHA